MMQVNTSGTCISHRRVFHKDSLEDDNVNVFRFIKFNSVPLTYFAIALFSGQLFPLQLNLVSNSNVELIFLLRKALQDSLNCSLRQIMKGKKKRRV